MRFPWRVGVVVLAAVLLVIPACVELSGQRITWFFDQANDVLYLLIHYDGIHESETGEPKGAEQIASFVKNGDVMFLGWPFHTDMAKLREALDGPDSLQKDAARLLTSRVQVEVLGYYRELDGRMGAAQLVTIPKASDFLRQVNRLIDRSVLKEPMDPGFERTAQRMRAAAREGHSWLAFEGQALKVTVPIHPAEWARAKAGFLRELGHAAGREAEEDGGGRPLAFELPMLTSLPCSYIEEENQVTFLLGRRDRPATWRHPIRERYEPSLEEAVVQNVKVDLDRLVADVLMGTQKDRSPGLAHLLDWGPPEEKVRALLKVVKRGREPEAAAARKLLKEFAAGWRKEPAIPAAPADTCEGEAMLKAWTDWYAQMKRFPDLPAPSDGKGSGGGRK